jgi:hypothetical protein
MRPDEQPCRQALGGGNMSLAASEQRGSTRQAKAHAARSWERPGDRNLVIHGLEGPGGRQAHTQARNRAGLFVADRPAHPQAQTQCSPLHTQHAGQTHTHQKQTQLESWRACDLCQAHAAAAAVNKPSFSSYCNNLCMPEMEHAGLHASAVPWTATTQTHRARRPISHTTHRQTPPPSDKFGTDPFTDSA